MSPFTCTSGKATWLSVDRNQSPLASPFDAASHVSIVLGEEIGAAASVECIRPKNDPILALPGLILRKPQRSGMFLAVAAKVAARSLVRELHDSSRAQSAAYLRICSSVSSGYQMKFPGGLTPTITLRWMLVGWRQA